MVKVVGSSATFTTVSDSTSSSSDSPGGTGSSENNSESTAGGGDGLIVGCTGYDLPVVGCTPKEWVYGSTAAGLLGAAYVSLKGKL